MDEFGGVVDLHLIIKCLVCKHSYEKQNLCVRMDGITDPDDGSFVHYEVHIDHSDGAPGYVQDLLCPKPKGTKHCSVFGRMGTMVFAFPHLTLSKSGTFWISEPDSQGNHLAVRSLKAVAGSASK